MTEAYEAGWTLRQTREEDERISECDCCQQPKKGCVMVPVIWTHPEANACPECRGHSPENY